MLLGCPSSFAVHQDEILLKPGISSTFGHLNPHPRPPHIHLSTFALPPSSAVHRNRRDQCSVAWIPNVRLPPPRCIFAFSPHIDAFFTPQNPWFHFSPGSASTLHLPGLRLALNAQWNPLPQKISSSHPSSATFRRLRSLSSRLPPRPQQCLFLQLPLPLPASCQALRTTCYTILSPLPLWSFVIPFPLRHLRSPRINKRSRPTPSFCSDQH